MICLGWVQKRKKIRGRGGWGGWVHLGGWGGWVQLRKKSPPEKSE